MGEMLKLRLEGGREKCQRKWEGKLPDNRDDKGV